jgi:hypothetical protein
LFVAPLEAATGLAPSNCCWSRFSTIIY